MTIPTTLLDVLAQRMAYGAAQDAQLARNIANANTPHYVPAYVDDGAADGTAEFGAVLALTTTQPGHIGPQSPQGNGVGRTVRGTATTLTPDGNGVSLTHEMFLKDQNASTYQAATSLYHKVIGWMKTAIGTNTSAG
jgi:flagellar basal-body rod protein FlgB